MKGGQTIESALVEVTDARCEEEAERVAQLEDVIDRSSGVGYVFADDQLAFMIEHTVEDMSGLAGICGDDLGAERREPVSDVGVEQHTGVSAVAGLPLTAGAEKLPVRGRCVARSPYLDERMWGVAVDDRRQRRPAMVRQVSLACRHNFPTSKPDAGGYPPQSISYPLFLAHVTESAHSLRCRWFTTA